METQIKFPLIKPTHFKGQKVVSTGQLAALLKCKRQNISDVFRNHKAEFIEGVDYFFLEKDDLYNFKVQNGVFEDVEGIALACHVFPELPQPPVFPISKTANNAYVWTKSGVEKHAAFFRTNRAKLVLQSWLPFYFDDDWIEHLAPAPKTEPPQISPREKLEYLKFLILNCTDENLRDSLIKSALELLD